MAKRRKSTSRTRTVTKTKWRTRAKLGMKRRYKSGFGGGISKLFNWKNTLVGSLGLIGMQRYQPFGGVYKPAIDKIALGIISPMIGFDNQDMLTVGVKEGIATVVNQYLGGSAASPLGGL